MTLRTWWICFGASLALCWAYFGYWLWHWTDRYCRALTDIAPATAAG